MTREGKRDKETGTQTDKQTLIQTGRQRDKWVIHRDRVYERD